MSKETILAAMYADPAIVVFGDYISSADREQLQESRFAAEASIPDIDFFLPGASIQISPLTLQDQQESAIDDLRELFLYFSRECPLMFQALLQGR